jgi:Mg-chelatase subunit ChlD
VPFFRRNGAEEEPKLTLVERPGTSSTIGIDTPMSESTYPLTDVSVEIHPLATKDGMVVKVQTPKEPIRAITHETCDIVLVIDVSGSMGTNAPVPSNPGEATENYGLSVLDLTKHAARTIMETMGDGDRLGIVTFASSARVLQKLTPMTRKNKVLANKNIDSMQPTDATNLWHGILEATKLFANEANTGRVPAIMVLTDGMPNYM